MIVGYPQWRRPRYEAMKCEIRKSADGRTTFLALSVGNRGTAAEEVWTGLHGVIEIIYTIVLEAGASGLFFRKIRTMRG